MAADYSMLLHGIEGAIESASSSSSSSLLDLPFSPDMDASSRNRPSSRKANDDFGGVGTHSDFKRSRLSTISESSPLSLGSYAPSPIAASVDGGGSSRHADLLRVKLEVDSLRLANEQLKDRLSSVTSELRIEKEKCTRQLLFMETENSQLKKDLAERTDK